MKVLFVASNSLDADSLELNREITILQRRFAEAAGEPASLVSLLSLHAEELPYEIAKHRPDVLHISAHGDKNHLSFANAAGKDVILDAEMLAAFFPADYRPRLVYINACDSFGLAKELAAMAVPMVIGTTDVISNSSARLGASAFYERILIGGTVKQSFDVAKFIIRQASGGLTDAVLETRAGTDASLETLHAIPRLIADFEDGDPTASRGQYSVRLGLLGCPANTVQVIFFTDDASFIDDEDEEDPYGEMSHIIRDTPANGRIWIPEHECWAVEGDFRLFAVGVSGDGHSFSVVSTLCEAIERRYLLAPRHDIPDDIARAIVELRRKDGAELDYAEERRERLRRQPVAPAGGDRGAVKRKRPSKERAKEKKSQ